MLRRSTAWFLLAFPVLAVAAAAQDTWAPITSAGPTQGSNRATAVWTGDEMIVWGGNPAVGAPTNLGLRYRPASDSWSLVSSTGVPSGRALHTAVWTGREMIVWGGMIDNSNTLTNTGGRYDPQTDTWSPMSTTGAPSARLCHSAVWTGREMLVWGGFDPAGLTLGDGARYDPVSDIWTPISATGAPTSRAFHAAVWTGREMLIWSGRPTANTGARYDPAADAWTPMTTVGAPDGRSECSAVWSGREMIVWGGNSELPNVPYLNTGGRYDPVLDVWRPTTTTGAPTGRIYQSTIWNGREMIVFGGHPPSPPTLSLNDGSRYDPLRNHWSPLPASGNPGPRALHTAVWTGREMIVFGGLDYTSTNGLFTGGRYTPPTNPTNGWLPISNVDAPRGREDHTAVWTGREMIVWGGQGRVGPAVSPLDSGGRYDSTADSWTPTSMVGAPTARLQHAAVWTGREMIIWGGSDGGPSLGGGRYDPVSDTWTSINLTNAPTPRFDHPAVWTGREMIIWGGGLINATETNAGARYDPRTDTWTPMSTTGAPSPRRNHSAIWTGREMIVWGGVAGATYQPGGARYDPRTNTWSPMSTTGATLLRGFHQAFWTGSEMIIWGGGNGPTLNTGERYTPATDSWTSMSMVGVPGLREDEVAAWTGSEMLLWGGNTTPFPSTDGARYDALSDTWTPMTKKAQPSFRRRAAGVWTGRYLLVWGGESGKTPMFLDNGSAYGAEFSLSGKNGMTAVESCTASISGGPFPAIVAFALAAALLRRSFRR